MNAIPSSLETTQAQEVGTPVQCASGVVTVSSSPYGPDRAASERRADTRTGHISDPMGLGLSALCLIHCLALPFIVSLLPMLGGILEHGALLHIGLFLLVIPVAAIAMFEGWQRHRLVGPALFAATGCALLLAAIMTHGDEVTETALTVAGSLCLITGHVVNWSRSVASGNR